MSTTKKNVNTVNTTTTKGNTTTAKGKKVEKTTTTTETPKPTPVNWARLTESQRASIVNTVSGVYGSISAIKKPENKALIINEGIPVTIGDKVTVYHFNDKGYLSLLKAVKDTRRAELKKDIKTLKTGYDFNRALFDRFVWAMGTPQYAQYCKVIQDELGEISPDTVGAWVEKFFPYQDKDHNIMFPVWVCATATAKTPGIVGRCAKMLLYPETITTGTAARVFVACIDNWGKLAAKAVGVTKDYTAPTTYENGTCLEICKFDPTTGEKGARLLGVNGMDFFTAYGAGELTTVTRWKKSLEIAANGAK